MGALRPMYLYGLKRYLEDVKFVYKQINYLKDFGFGCSSTYVFVWIEKVFGGC
nr:MAG TPA: protein of unknown function (DUF4744) [Bacteriophage sp.]